MDFGSEPYLIKIGDNVRITKGVQFITHDGSLWVLKKMGMMDMSAVKYGNIVIGNNCNIGNKVIIMPNVHIGNNCIVGAGAIVTKNIPDNSVVAGVPAKYVETVQEYYEKVKYDTLPTFAVTSVEKKEILKKERPQWFD